MANVTITMPELEKPLNRPAQLSLALSYPPGGSKPEGLILQFTCDGGRRMQAQLDAPESRRCMDRALEFLSKLEE